MSHLDEVAAIRKHADPFGLSPNLRDDPTFRTSFTWDQACAELEGLPGGGLNIAHECIDRHARETPRRVAVRWRGRDGRQVELTYGALRNSTSRFANVLDMLGVDPGERVFMLTGRVPELYTAVLGTLKHGSVACTLLSAYGPQPLRQRLDLGDARVLVTTSALYRRKIAQIRGDLPGLRYVLVVDDERPTDRAADVVHLRSLLASASPTCHVAETGPEDMALLHFTSGTTGTPKGAIHVHQAIASHRVTARWALDLHPDDVFWCTADPGWVTGMSYGILAPLALGVTSVVDEADFDATRWYELLQEERVSVWYTAPTAIRMMMKDCADAARQFRYPDLRFIASVG